MPRSRQPRNVFYRNPSYSGDSTFSSKAAQFDERLQQAADTEAFKRLNETKDYAGFAAYMKSRIASMGPSDPNRITFESALKDANNRGQEKQWSEDVASGKKTYADILKELNDKVGTVGAGSKDALDLADQISRVRTSQKTEATNKADSAAALSYAQTSDHRAYGAYLSNKLATETDPRVRANLQTQIDNMAQRAQAQDNHVAAAAASAAKAAGKGKENPAAAGSVEGESFSNIKSAYEKIKTEIANQQESGVPATPAQLTALIEAGGKYQTSLRQLAANPKATIDQIEKYDNHATKIIPNDIKEVKIGHDNVVLRGTPLDTNKKDKEKDKGTAPDKYTLTPGQTGPAVNQAITDIAAMTNKLERLAPALWNNENQTRITAWTTQAGTDVKATYTAMFQKYEGQIKEGTQGLAVPLQDIKEAVERNNKAAQGKWEAAREAFKANPVNAGHAYTEPRPPHIYAPTSTVQLANLIAGSGSVEEFNRTLGLTGGKGVLATVDFSHLQTVANTALPITKALQTEMDNTNRSFRDSLALGNNLFVTKLGLDPLDETVRAARHDYNPNGNGSWRTNAPTDINGVNPQRTEFAKGHGFIFDDGYGRRTFDDGSDKTGVGAGGKPQFSLIGEGDGSSNGDNTDTLSSVPSGVQSPDAQNRNAPVDPNAVVDPNTKVDHINAGLALLDTPHPIHDMAPVDIGTPPNVPMLPPEMPADMVPADTALPDVTPPDEVLPDVTPPDEVLPDLPDVQSPDAKDRNKPAVDDQEITPVRGPS